MRRGKWNDCGSRGGCHGNRLRSSIGRRKGTFVIRERRNRERIALIDFWEREAICKFALRVDVLANQGWMGGGAGGAGLVIRR